MDYHSLHSWNVSPTEAVRIQSELREQIRLKPLRKKPRLVAGGDISYNRFSSTAYAGFVVVDAHTLQIVARSQAVGEMTFPYVPGLLSFRELPVLIQAWERLDTEPDVVVLDGQGICHPRRLGIATHMGLMIQKPTIGCAKSLLTGHFKTPALKRGSHSPIVDHDEAIGAALRTRDRVQPIYVSPGHLTTLEDAIELMLQTSAGYRIPEPTRQAHLWVNELRRRQAI